MNIEGLNNLRQLGLRNQSFIFFSQYCYDKYYLLLMSEFVNKVKIKVREMSIEGINYTKCKG